MKSKCFALCKEIASVFRYTRRRPFFEAEGRLLPYDAENISSPAPAERKVLLAPQRCTTEEGTLVEGMFGNRSDMIVWGILVTSGVDVRISSRMTDLCTWARGDALMPWCALAWRSPC
ncbi:hypothetical protein H2248_007293 [Termitomyces sp. 'cryptogamus']|nr:hypothetical protein H2248_007293 [Termitomyces sp. 'cryptogamus']